MNSFFNGIPALFYYAAMLLVFAFALLLVDSLLRLYTRTIIRIASGLFKSLGFGSAWTRLEELFAADDADARVLRCGRCDQKISVNQKGLYTCPSCKLEFYWEAEKEPFLVSNGDYSNNLFLKAELGDVSAQYELAKIYCDGEGRERNLVQAYKWANITSSTTSAPLIQLRDKIVRQIAPSELEFAQELVSQFKPKEPPHVTVKEKEKLGCVWSFVIYLSSLTSVLFLFLTPLAALLEYFPVIEAYVAQYTPLAMIVLLRIVPDYTAKVAKAVERALLS